MSLLWDFYQAFDFFSFYKFAQLEAGQELPPPALLKRKIIIKNKKKHHHHHHHKKHPKKPQATLHEDVEDSQDVEDDAASNTTAAGENGPPPDIIPQNEVPEGGGTAPVEQQIGNGNGPHAPMLQQRQGSKDSTQEDDGMPMINSLRLIP